VNKISAFHHNLYSFSISDPDVDLLRKNLDSMFNNSKIKYGHYRGGEVVGSGKSTISTPNSILRLNGIDTLISLVKDCIKQVDPTKCINSDDIIFESIWANRNFKGSTVKVHRHPKNLENVCIFYIDVPEKDCADLVVVKSGVPQTLLDNYPESEKVYIKVKTGDLIMHSPDVLHAVSEHKSDYPRTCIILNYFIKERT